MLKLPDRLIESLKNELGNELSVDAHIDYAKYKLEIAVRWKHLTKPGVLCKVIVSFNMYNLQRHSPEVADAVIKHEVLEKVREAKAGEDNGD